MCFQQLQTLLWFAISESLNLSFLYLWYDSQFCCTNFMMADGQLMERLTAPAAGSAGLILSDPQLAVRQCVDFYQFYHDSASKLLVGGLEQFLFSHILGIIIPTRLSKCWEYIVGQLLFDPNISIDGQGKSRTLATGRPLSSKRSMFWKLNCRSFERTGSDWWKKQMEVAINGGTPK